MQFTSQQIIQRTVENRFTIKAADILEFLQTKIAMPEGKVKLRVRGHIDPDDFANNDMEMEVDEIEVIQTIQLRPEIEAATPVQEI